ncbi:hypothetical protein ACL02S_22310 [Nocardia sp. 004]|uniref:hypothetical protein n=1 Tax=Nocardia sp. 004 TaxID=3385978 RepID=UPI0039A124E3
MQSAYAKLSRAKKHLAELQTEIETYRNSDAVSFRVRSRKDPLDSSMVIAESVARVKTPPPSEQYRTLHVLVTVGTVTFDCDNRPITELPVSAEPIVDGAVLGRTRVMKGLWGSGPKWVDVPGVAAYIEHIDAPGFGERPVGALDLMKNLTAATETFLGELRHLGC